MRDNVREALEWARGQIDHPSQSWQGLCQSFSRQTWGLPAFGTSARNAWHAIPDKYRHGPSRPEDIPAGAICYIPDLGTYGHAFIMGHKHSMSNDVRRRGRIDYAPKAFPWAHGAAIRWADGTPYGDLPLYDGPGSQGNREKRARNRDRGTY